MTLWREIRPSARGSKNSRSGSRSTKRRCRWRTSGVARPAGAEQLLQLTPEARRILGFEPAGDVRNLDLFNVVHPDDREEFLKVIWAARRDFAAR